MNPMGLLTIWTKAAQLGEINFTFDTQNMPKNAEYEIFSGFVKARKSFVLQYPDNKLLNI